MGALRSPRRGSVAAATLLIVLAGCGGGESALPPAPLPTPTQAPPVSVDQVFADLLAAGATAPGLAGALAGGLAAAGQLTGEANSAAAQLRAGLAVGLVENVQLTAVVALAGYRFGWGSPAATAATATLLGTTTRLSDALVGAATDERTAFVAAWDARSTGLLAYARAAGDGPAGETARRAASAGLLTNAKTLAGVFSDVSDDVLSVSATARDLVASATRITEVLDALGAGSPEAAKRLRAADDQAGDLAAVLAGGMDRGGELAGDPATDAAALRADLAGLLAEGTYLAGLAGFAANTAPEGAAAPLAVAARDAADANAQSLATTVGAAIGRDRQAGFISLWRNYVEDLHGYLGADGAGRAAVGARLAAFPANAASFLSEATKGALAVPEVSAALGAAVQAAIRAMDALRTLRNVPLAVPTAPTTTAGPTASPSSSAPPSTTPSATATGIAIPTATPSGTASPGF